MSSNSICGQSQVVTSREGVSTQTAPHATNPVLNTSLKFMKRQYVGLVA